MQERPQPPFLFRNAQGLLGMTRKYNVSFYFRVGVVKRFYRLTFFFLVSLAYYCSIVSESKRLFILRGS